MLSYISSTGQERKGNDLNTETFNPGQTQVRSLFLSGWTFNANALNLACEEADSDAHTNTHTQTHTHTEIHTLHRYLILHTIHDIPLQYDTRQYSTWHCITFYTLHYITVHYITFHYSTLHYIRIQQVVHRTTLHTLHKVSLHDIELHYITLPHSMLGVYRTPLCVQLKWPSLSKFSGIWNISSDISAPRVPARPCSCGMLYIYIYIDIYHRGSRENCTYEDSLGRKRTVFTERNLCMMWRCRRCAVNARAFPSLFAVWIIKPHMLAQ